MSYFTKLGREKEADKCKNQGPFLHSSISNSRENKNTVWLLPCCWLSWPFSPRDWSLEQGMSPAGWLVWHSASLLNQLHATSKIFTSLKLNMPIFSIDEYYYLPHKVPIRIKCGSIDKKFLARGRSQVFSNYLLFLSCHACFQRGVCGSHASSPSAPLAPLHCALSLLLWH